MVLRYHGPFCFWGLLRVWLLPQRSFTSVGWHISRGDDIKVSPFKVGWGLYTPNSAEIPLLRQKCVLSVTLLTILHRPTLFSAGSV